MKTSTRTLAGAALIALLPLTAARAQSQAPQIPVKIYAQELVDRMVAQHPDLRAVVMHVTPPKEATNVIIASSIGRIGKPADAADLDVVATGRTRVAMDRGNKRIEVELALRDVGGEIIGSLALVWRYPVVGDHDEFERSADVIRDGLSRRILNLANLMDPYPFVAGATTKSRAQSLVDDTLLRHPEVTVLALRARVQPGNDLVLLGSTFGRHGKKADGDDMKVLDSAAPATGIYSNGRRFGVDLALHDKAGTAIGTMNVGYPYRNGEDTKPLLAQAVSLRNELQAKIAASSGTLDDVDP
jgi:iron complex outermembrane receptor protein